VQGSLSCVGPLARRVTDVGLLFAAIRERAESKLDIEGGTAGLRIGVPANLEAADEEVRGLFETVCTSLAAEGAIVQRVGALNFEAGRAAMWIITGVEYAEALRPYVRHRADDLHPLTRALLERAEYIPGTEYVRAQRSRVALCREMADIMRDVDVLLTPTVPTAAYPKPAPIDHPSEAADHPVNMSTMFTALFNVTGQPAVTVPCGLTADGLPVGAQFVARPYAEQSALRVARAYERVSPWAYRTAPLSVSALRGSTGAPTLGSRGKAGE
jgi:aspartyl-tRNA(Asn)/glutamyl-tRNA(Gln) amidotransferase subunit A